jgi:signal peptidase II
VWFALGVLSVLLALTDICTKADMQRRLAQAPGRTVVAIPGILDFAFRTNPGGPFSLLAGSRYSWLLGPLALLAIIAVVWWLIRSPLHSRLEALACAIIVGGAAGNLYDRFRFGVVRDFLELTFVSWPVFNLADVFICIGVGLLLVSLLLGGSRGPTPETSSSETPA